MKLSRRDRIALGVFGAATAFVVLAFATLIFGAPFPVVGAISILVDRKVSILAGPSWGASAISVAVLERGKIAHEFAAGSMDDAHGHAVPATPQTPFHAPDLSRLLIDVSVMQMVDEGRVVIDDPIATYVREAPHGSEITVRELLAGTSGLPDGYLNQLDARALSFVPGKEASDDDSGYAILVIMLEQLDGKPFAEIERQRIFSRAGMSESSFVKPAHRARDPAIPDELVTTAGDLARFDAALTSGILLSAASFEEMRRNEIPDWAEAERGFAMEVAPFRGGELVSTGGESPTFAVSNCFSADGRIGVVVLSNGLAPIAEESIVQSVLVDTDPFAYIVPAGRSKTDPNDPSGSIGRSFRAFLAAISRQHVDPLTLSNTMNDSMTAAETAHLASTLPPYEQLRTVTLVSRKTDGSDRVYAFRADYDLRSVDYEFSVDADDRIDNLSFQ